MAEDNGQGTFHFTPRYTRAECRDVILRELHAEIEAQLKPGMAPINCPVCGQKVKLYRRKLNSGMARALIRLYLHERHHPGTSMDYRNWNARGEAREHSLMRFWHLIEPDPDRVGYWRITDVGLRFIDLSRGAVAHPPRLPRAIWHFNNRCYGYTVEETTLRRALGDKFDLDELLASAPAPGMGDDFVGL